MNRTLYIGGFCMPDGNAAAQRVLTVGKLMGECNYKVRFCGLQRNIMEPVTGKIEEFEYRNHPYPSSIIAWVKYLTGRDYAISEINQYKPDIVILYNHPALAIEHIASYCHSHGIKVIADVTEWYEPAGNLMFKVIKGADTRRRMCHSHKKLDGLICISNYLAKYYSGCNLPILNLPPLVDISQRKWHQSFEKDNSVIKIVYAGSPGSTKDRLDLIIQSMATILDSGNNNVKFDVIGITKKQYTATWGDENDYPFVTFYGRLSHEEVIKHLLSADFQIFLRPDTLPNRAGFPTKFVETITSGTIPITNLSSNLSDYLINGVNGFVIKSIFSKDIDNVLYKVLSLRCDTIDTIRLNLDTSIFDYHRYSSYFQSFISKL